MINNTPESSEMLIRGHHVALLANTLNQTPQDYAAQARRDLESWRCSATSQTVDLDAWTGEPFGAVTAYAYDLIGETPEQAAAYEAGLANFIQHYNGLNPTTTVKLIVNEFDLICDACTFKRHCATSGSVTGDSSSTVDRDTVRVVEDIADYLNSGSLVPNHDIYSESPLRIKAAKMQQITSLLGKAAAKTGDRESDIIAVMRRAQEAGDHALAASGFRAYFSS